MKILHLATLSLLALLSVGGARAEKLTPASQLPPFTTLRVEANIDLSLSVCEAGAQPSISYDLGDNSAEKFKFGVKPDGELLVSLSRNVKSIDRVKATIYYSELDAIRISYASVTFATPFETSVADITLENNATLSGELACDDLILSLYVDSRVDLTGESRYLSLKAASGSKAELRGVDIQSIKVEASQGAVVALTAGERLDLSAATNSVVKYWGEPKILRSRKAALLGGSIVHEK